MRSAGRRKHFLKGSIAMGALIAFTQAVPAYAQQQTYSFDIPAQDLGAALRAFARASRQQVTFDDSAVRGKRAPALKGSYTADQALDILLSGSGLAAQRGRSGLFIVRPLAGANSPASPQSASSSGDVPLEPGDIVVTGTLIRGVENRSAPAVVLKKNELEQQGIASVEQALSKVPSNLSEISFTGPLADGASTLSASNIEGASGVSLRGLGPGSTLVLLNGRRRPGTVGGRVFDISAIPLSALDRIEIVTGGRSAIYGSDAVAGVVNLVTRRPFNGAETEIYYGGADGGADRFEASQTVGVKDLHGGIVASYDYMHESRFDLADAGTYSEGTSGVTPVLGKFDLLPKSRRHSVLLSADYELLPTVQVYGDFQLTDKRNAQQLSEIFSGVFPFSRDTKIHSTQFSGNIGARVAIDPAWDLDVSALAGQVTDRRHSNANDFLTFARTRSRVHSATAVVNGSLGELPAGTARIALGGELRRESYRNNDTELSSLQSRSRTISSAFGEATVPIRNSEQSRIDATLATRFDNYSDFGSTVNYQAGLAWDVAKKVLLRGAFSTAYRAPDLYSLSSSNQVILFDAPDPLSPSGTSPTAIWQGGNPDLEPEKARTYSLGFDWTPSQSTRFSLTYFNITYRNRIDAPASGEEVLTALTDPDAFGDLIIRTPSAEFVGDVVRSSQNDFRDAINGDFDTVNGDLLALYPSLVVFDNRSGNISAQHVSGLDVSASHRLETQRGSLTFRADGTFYFEFKRRLRRVGDFDSQLNRLGRPVDLRLRGQTVYEHGPITTTLSINYTDGYPNELDPGAHVSKWITTDVSFALIGDRATIASWAHGWRFILAADNLFDKKPPKVSNTFFGIGFDPANANPLGRVVSVRLGKKW